MEGGSPGNDSVDSGAKKSSVSSSGRSRNCKQFLRRFLDSNILTANLEDWFEEKLEQSANKKTSGFDVPFELIDLQKFDYALEGASFQQLIRMPNAIYDSGAGAIEAAAYLAVEDFLHAGTKGLWEAFWSQDGPMPFYAACCWDEDTKFYQAEKAIAQGKLGGLCATAILLKNPRHPHGRWEDILEIALLRPDIASLAMEDQKSFSSVIGEAIFFAIRVLLSRSISRSNIPRPSSVFVLLVDSQYCGVVKIEGDVNKMECDVNNVYGCAAEWTRSHSRVAVSPIDKIWNKLGNANWGDIGALQVLYATFHCIESCYGMPTHSIEDLAAEHSIRLQARRSERHLGEETRVNGGNGLFRLRKKIASPEIVEVQEEETIRIESKEKSVKLEVGSVLRLEDSNSRKSYQIKDVLSDGEIPYYIAYPVDDPTNFLFLYVGSHPSQLEQAWEDMKLWYQVQRQVKVLTLMRQKGVSDKHLPQLSASGRIVHSGQCQKQPSSGGANCNHPLCGTSILVTSPVGKTVANMVRDGEFGADEAIRCCHDCLSALSTAASAGIRHGDIRPDNIIWVRSALGSPYFVLVGWGHAVLEERDRPALNLHYSSTYALQEGKLCSASDAESLVYLLYFAFSEEDFPELDSVEGALQWREKSWSKRLIQQKLGEISAVLKALSDYVDSLCGTPYPMDFGIWIRRLSRHIRDDDEEDNRSGIGPSC